VLLAGACADAGERWQAVGMSDQTSDQTKPARRPSDDELRDRLTPLQYEVTQRAGTERAFSGEYWDTKDPGMYHCVVCDEPLFTSETKYDSGSGWPSFWEALDPEKVTLHEDHSMGMVRTEVLCSTCGAHLGHLFPDGPRPTGERYCMNSASLRLEPTEG
jgi:peptide-methionine (R)-S-oxide reductase